MDLFSEGSIHGNVSNIHECLRRELHGEQKSAFCSRAPECDSLALTYNQNPGFMCLYTVLEMVAETAGSQGLTGWSF